jgi:RNA polymerase sigma-70 factor, ECF subfamily
MSQPEPAAELTADRCRSIKFAPTESTLALRRQELDGLIRHSRTRLHRRALLLTRNHADANDLLQDTFLRALTCRATDLRSGKSFRWLLTVMQNLHRDRCRVLRGRKVVPITENVWVTLPFDEQSKPEWQSMDLEQLLECVERLDSRLREPYVLQAKQGLSLDAIARQLQVPAATVGTRVFRARRQLRALLRNGGGQTPVKPM